MCGEDPKGRKKKREKKRRKWNIETKEKNK
jgi:hypothetical protein